MLTRLGGFLCMTVVGLTFAVALAFAVGPACAAGAPAREADAKMPGQAVTLATPDGVELAGTWWAGEGRGPAVLLLHMVGGRRADWQPVAAELSTAGFRVLAVDFRGHGESRKQGSRRLDFTDFTTREWRQLTDDAAAALAWMRARPEVDTACVGVVGASIGANSALIAASNDPRVRTVVLLSPGLDYHGLRTERAMEKYGTRPIFLLASADDEASAAAVKRLGSLARGRNAVKVFQAAGHGTDMFRAEPTLPALVRGWLAEQLR
ncbi:MAG: alpha/beta fold hydrolase [Candidatus Eisenbacteria bacterium]|nr:alpha/beta fold hydrolase [Candidatus Eisenbacteria bacterium]